METKEKVEKNIDEKTECELCEGTGEVSSPYRDSDGNWSDTDTRKCECKY